MDKPRPQSLADRLNLLKDAQEGWRSRVSEKDTKRFTVEGKMMAAGEELGRAVEVS